MSQRQHVGAHHRTLRISYAQSLSQRLYGYVLIPALVLLGTVFLIHQFAGASPTHAITFSTVLWALCSTFGRLWVAYCLALLVSIPLGILVTHNALAERIFLPFFDILQSLPVLAFFPVIIVFFIHWGMVNAAAIFILFVTMLWNIVFSLVGGLHSIPEDIQNAGRIFGLRHLAYIDKILLPAAVPYLITGSLLAWAQGWNIVIVAEVLHTYIPGSTSSADLFGIGSLLVNSASAGDQQTFLVSIAVMIVAIAILNLFVWQKLLHYAERYKFE